MPRGLQEFSRFLVAGDKAIEFAISFLIALNVALISIKLYMQIQNNILLRCLRHASSPGQQDGYHERN